MMDADTPCHCPRCRWLGTLHDTHEYRPMDADFNELPPRNVCPRCAPEVEVQTLGQKGLDGLRREHSLLQKGSFYRNHASDKDERRAQIERFFEHIQQPHDA